MLLLRSLIIFFLLCSPAYAVYELLDEGVSKGFPFKVDCVGAGVSCARSGGTGTLTISGTAGGIATSDIDTSAKLGAILSDESGTGHVVYTNDAFMTSLTVSTALTITEGILTDSIIVSADIKDDEVTALDLNSEDFGDFTCAAGTCTLDTDYEEDLLNSAGLASALSDESGTGNAVFTNDAFMTDLTVSTSLTIPSAANPTVDEDGEIAIDTTVGQLVYMSGATARIFYPQAPRCVAVENLAAADDNMSMGSFGQAVTVERVWCYFRGTGTTPATIKLHDSSGNDFTHDTVNCYFGLATPLLVSANNALVATETFEFDVTNAVSPETDEYTICVDYLYTRQ